MVSGTWTCIANHTNLERSSHILSTIDHNAYIFGGELVPREPRDNELFCINLNTTTTAVAHNPVSTITTSSESPSPRVGSAAATYDGKIYIFSGRGGTAMTPIEEDGRLWCFDQSTTSWSLISPASSTAPHPPARSYHTMTYSPDPPTIFLHAGCPASSRLSDLWAFDLSSGNWTQLSDAPGPARGGTSIACLERKLYRMNGFDGNTEQGGAMDIFDISANTWSTVPFVPDGKEGPEARSVSALVPVTLAGREKLVTLFGERDPSVLGHAGAGKMLGDWWVWDVESQVWEKGENVGDKMPQPRGWFDADVAEDGKIVVSGGLSETNERLSDIWVLSVE